MYHINNQGNAGQCRAKTGNCPYGGNDRHFPTHQEAREAFESGKIVLPQVKRKSPRRETLAEYLERCRAVQAHDLR